MRQARVVDQVLPNANDRAVSAMTVITRTIKSKIPTNGSASINGKPSTSSNGNNAFVTKTIVIKKDGYGATTSSAHKKPKTAPLMQKSMQLFKGRFRR